jgi:hypothetical protein
MRLACLATFPAHESVYVLHPPVTSSLLDSSILIDIKVSFLRGACCNNTEHFDSVYYIVSGTNSLITCRLCGITNCTNVAQAYHMSLPDSTINYVRYVSLQRDILQKTQNASTL